MTMNQAIVDLFLESDHVWDDELTETENLIEWMLGWVDYKDADQLIAKVKP